MLRFFRRVLIGFFLAALLSGAVAGYFAYRLLEYRNPETRTVYVEKGSSVRVIAASLARSGVISDAVGFEIYLRLSGLSGRLKAGEYEFPAGDNLVAVAERLSEGKTKTYQLTIPEGFTIRDVCRVFVEKKLAGETDCLALVSRGEWLGDGTAAATLEGYLFPETYTYDSQTTAAELLQAMLTMFRKKVGPEREAKARQRGLSLHQAVILASVVEKETGAAAERPLIAGVFHNRLKIGMPLQSDPTTIYGLPKFNGNLTRADLMTDSPYNTYTRQGLPAGPICNPGLAAIDAVLDPAATEALYFVAKGDGAHYFSRTLEEHNRAVQRYQLGRGGQEP